MGVRRIASGVIAIGLLFTGAAVRSEPRNYAQAVGYVIGQIRYVKWMGELCSERFPETKARNTAAYLDWQAYYLAFINEMEGQFGVMDSYFRNLPQDGGGKNFSAKDISDWIDAQKPSLKRDNEALGEQTYRWKCQVYPERVAARRNDLEAALAGDIATVRRGPQSK